MRLIFTSLKQTPCMIETHVHRHTYITCETDLYFSKANTMHGRDTRTQTLTLHVRMIFTSLKQTPCMIETHVHRHTYITCETDLYFSKANTMHDRHTYTDTLTLHVRLIFTSLKQTPCMIETHVHRHTYITCETDLYFSKANTMHDRDTRTQTHVHYMWDWSLLL